MDSFKKRKHSGCGMLLLLLVVTSSTIVGSLAPVQAFSVETAHPIRLRTSQIQGLPFSAEKLRLTQERRHPWSTQSRASSTRLAMSGSPPRIRVALDEPLFDSFTTSSKTTGGGGGGGVLSSLSLLWTKLRQSLSGTSSVRIATFATMFVLFFWIVLANNSGGIATALKLMQGRTQVFKERVSDALGRKQAGIPMTLDENTNEGWGICTLRSKDRCGNTSFFRYQFDLPNREYVLPLELGETVLLSCLDNQEDVVQAEFFPFQPERNAELGTFSILVPEPKRDPTPSSSKLRTMQKDGSALVGDLSSLNDTEQANLVRVIQNDLNVGDEVALRPASSRLEYKGQHFPVTDIVYIAAGAGIAPVLEQVRAVLRPSSGSSVESATVLWINDAVQDFDVAAKALEREYYMYSRKLDVTLVALDQDGQQPERERLSDVADIDMAVGKFKPGTMAVVAGKSSSVKKALAFLQEERGFPRDCICIL